MSVGTSFGETLSQVIGVIYKIYACENWMITDVKSNGKSLKYHKSHSNHAREKERMFRRFPPLSHFQHVIVIDKQIL